MQKTNSISFKTTLSTIFFYALLILLFSSFDFIFDFNYSKTKSSIVTNALQSEKFLLSIIYYLVVSISIYFLVVLYCHQTSLVIIKKFKLQQEVKKISFLVSLIFILNAHLLNFIYYPNSSFSFNGPKDIIFYIPLFLTIALVLPITLNLISKLIQSSLIIKVTILSSALILLFFYSTLSVKAKVINDFTNKKNVIVIGVDSLRPDSLANDRNLMPFLQYQLRNSMQFTNSYTPLARTFPSWMSILTGQYPLNNGARLNLTPREDISTENIITTTLSHQGYINIFATDERLFSNIDESYGFDLVIGPKVGSADFILSKYVDSPIINLVITLPYSEILFPHNKLNRASHKTYSPSYFVRKLSESIENTQQPVFLATHFCLAHSPYSWKDERTEPTQYGQYLKALNKVDVQIKFLYQDLKNKGLLTNSVVIFLSDHGEAFGEKNSMPDNTLSYGHGSDIRSLPQSKILLAFQIFEHGELISKKGEAKQLSSLIDITPTLESILKIEQRKYDGISLHPWLQQNSPTDIDRKVFLESGFYLPALMSQSPKVSELIEQGVNFYDINTNGYLEIKKNSIEIIFEQKQYGIIENNTLLSVRKIDNTKYNKNLINISTNSYFKDDDIENKLFTDLENHFKLSRLNNAN